MHRRRSVLVSALLAVQLVLGTAGSSLADHDATALLPNLQMLQPDEFRLDTTSGQRRLRFSTYILNRGPGRFDVVGTADLADPTKVSSVTQRLEQGGGWVDHTTTATMFYDGDGHGHYHVFGLQAMQLSFQATPADVLATGAKTGFCFWDNVNLSNATRYYSGARECELQPGGSVPMGLSVEWGDKYPYSIAYQWIELGNLPYGTYCLTLVADPRAEFVETTASDNTVRTLIEIRSSGVRVLAPECAAPTGTVHVADLDGATRAKGKRGRWEALATVRLRDGAGSPVGGATVGGAWSGAVSRSLSGVTAADGSVTLSSGTISGGSTATFTVESVSASGLAYAPADNTDPDGDSDGTVITISRP